MNYYKIQVEITDDSFKEIVLAQLFIIGFESVEETMNGIEAFVAEEDYDIELLQELLGQYDLSYTITFIPKQNWNAIWESNFQPIIVENLIGVRAAFHPPFSNVLHQVIITPKMSFGTGHHATTYLMIQLLTEINCVAKTVFDFGTGTGILAIVAEKLGAVKIVAVDNDDWCIENATENIESNECSNIELQKGDSPNNNVQFDIVLANINKHIIKENIHQLSNLTKKDGVILLSGLLTEDENEIVSLAYQQGWLFVKTLQKDNWIAIQFVK